MTKTREDVLRETPRLEGLLGRLRSRLVRQVFFYGLGTVLGVCTLWLAFAFLADWGLRVPRTVRVLHGLVLFGLGVTFLWRDLMRPLARLPRKEGLALLLERSDPELKELLVSAVQFQDPAADPGDAGLVQAVLSEADGRATSVDVRGVLDEETPRARLLLGVGGIGLFIIVAFLNPLYTGIFFERMFGGVTPWPQRTYLTLEIPNLGAGAQLDETPEAIRVRVARGTDVHVVVRAEGVVPDDVTLHFEGGRDLVLNKSGGKLFRTLLRSCQEDIAFHATGGDDVDRRPRVEVEVLQPPDVEGVAVQVRPPAYSGLEPEMVFNQDVEVLAGSELVIHVRPFPAEARGSVRLLPDDLVLALEPLPFPWDPASGPEPEEPASGLSFELVAEKSLGYRIELEDESGLTNPDPGLFRIRVVEDRPPEIQVLAPSRTEFEVVRGGAIPLRARAEDDFGLESMSWSVSPATGGDQEEPTEVLAGTFELIEVERDGERSESVRHRQSALGSVRLEVDDLGSEAAPVSVDQRFVFGLTAEDNRLPEPGVGRALPIRARVVTPAELLRRMQDRLAQARLEAIRLSDLQREKRQRVEDLLDSIQGDGALEGGESLALAAALSGQRRVLGDAQALARDLAGVAEDILYARLDEKAGTLLEFYDAQMAVVSDLSFHSRPWRALALAYRQGQLGTAGFAGNLVELVELGLSISDDHARGAVDALYEAEKALDAAATQRALVAASERQTESLASIENLLEELSEWDNFQNILALTRDILNRQKALRERTQQFASDK